MDKARRARLGERTRSRFQHRRWHPHWENSFFEKYARTVTKQNLWRVRKYLNGDFEDGLQECAMVFARCAKRYDNTEVDNPKWFMALYKRALYRHWVNLSWKDTRLRTAEEELISNQHYIEHVDANPAPLLLSWDALSEETKVAAFAIANAPTEILDWLFAPGSSLVTINRKLRRQFGLPLDINIMGELIKLLRT